MTDALVCAECGGVEVCDEDCKAAVRAKIAFTRQQRRLAEQAVIEAARKWNYFPDEENRWNLVDAVQALEAAEKKDE